MPFAEHLSSDVPRFTEFFRPFYFTFVALSALRSVSFFPFFRLGPHCENSSRKARSRACKSLVERANFCSFGALVLFFFASAQDDYTCRPLPRVSHSQCLLCVETTKFEQRPLLFDIFLRCMTPLPESLNRCLSGTSSSGNFFSSLYVFWAGSAVFGRVPLQHLRTRGISKILVVVFLA